MKRGIDARSYGAAEKDGEGMALKILTSMEDMPDAKEKLQRVYAHTKWKRAPAFRNKAGVAGCSMKE